jgi:hypothetical protein
MHELTVITTLCTNTIINLVCWLSTGYIGEFCQDIDIQIN